MNNVTRAAVGLLPKNTIEGLENFRQKHIHHPGKDVPFHVTLLENFYLPDEINEEVLDRMNRIASKTGEFMFFAKPLSSFPTSKVLYLTPSPVSQIEKLSQKLYDAYPQFGNSKKGFHTYHMTVALGYKQEEEMAVIKEFTDKFRYNSFELHAGYLAIFCECETGEWKIYKKISLGRTE